MPRTLSWFTPTLGVIILTLGILIAHNLAISPWMLDDSFISFRYAENLASGQGAVYNPPDRVEGYTSFLWVLILAVGKVSGLETVLLSQILGGAFALGCILLLCFSHKIVASITPWQSAVAGLLLGSCGIFTPWARSGMEVCLYTFLVLATILAYLRIREGRSKSSTLVGVSILAALTALTRPEGILLFGMIWTNFTLRYGRSLVRRSLLFAAPFAFIIAAHFLWRYSYYGYWLPNTFYVKVGSSLSQVLRGLEYLGGFSIAAASLLIAPITGLTMRFVAKEKLTLQSHVAFLITLIGLYLCYVVLVGGDIMPAYRFCTPLIPLLSLVTAHLLEKLIKSRTLCYAIIAVLFGYNVVQLFFDAEIHGHIAEDHVAQTGKEVGLAFRANFPANTVIATNTAGSIPYYSGFKSIDMLGLNDVHIAHTEVQSIGEGRAGHEKGDGEYILKLSPDIIQFGSSAGSKTPDYLSDRQIYKAEYFHRYYSYQLIQLPSGKYVKLYFKNSFFESQNRQK